jgi:hypothetical protein
MTHAVVLELNVFDGNVPAGPPSSPPSIGFFLLSFFVNVEATLTRLAGLGLGGPPRRVSQTTPRGPITLATVRPGWAAYLAHPRFDHPQYVTH